MTQITVRIKGNEAVQSGLQKATLAAQNLPASVIRPEMEQAVKDASGGYSGGNRYAVPERGGYVRTGTYGSGTKLVSGPSNQYRKTYKLESTAAYSRYVGGDAYGSGQAWMHKGRWPRIKDAVDAAVTRIQERAGEMFRRMLEGGPGGL